MKNHIIKKKKSKLLDSFKLKLQLHVLTANCVDHHRIRNEKEVHNK